MIPILTGSKFLEFDSNLAKNNEIDKFINRAGYSIYIEVLKILKNPYKKRVVVVAGPGHNGDDGKTAAKYLSLNNVSVKVLDTKSGVNLIEDCDLIVDAAFGTGLKRPFEFPKYANIPVVSVDIPTGLNCDTGEVFENAVKADYTVSFVGLKPGFFYNSGLLHTGKVVFKSLSVDSITSKRNLVQYEDFKDLNLRLNKTDHKWKHAAMIVAGSENMMGAANLTSFCAINTGASIVQVLSLNTTKTITASEAITQRFTSDWDLDLLDRIHRFKTVAIGPGLILTADDTIKLRNFLQKIDIPVVLDASALTAVASFNDPIDFLKSVKVPKILTPHTKEFAKLTNSSATSFNLTDVEEFAKKSNSIVLLKGPTTTVANPASDSFLVNLGAPNLATAGTGDVLTGLITGLVARSGSKDIFELTKITAFGAFIHALGSRPKFQGGVDKSLYAISNREDFNQFGLTSSKLIGSIVESLNEYFRQK